MKRAFIFGLFILCLIGCKTSSEWPLQFTVNNWTVFVESGTVTNENYINDNDIATYGEFDAKTNTVITFDTAKSKKEIEKKLKIKIECDNPTRIQVVSNLNSANNHLLFDKTVTQLDKTFYADYSVWNYHICIYPTENTKIKIYEIN